MAMVCLEHRLFGTMGSLWSQFLSQQGYIVFSMDSRGMGGRGEEFKILVMAICLNFFPSII